LWPLRSAVVSPVKAPKRLRKQAAAAALQILRLSSSLEVSVTTFARTTLGVDRQAEPDWWSYPTPWLLARIAAKTEMNIARVREMSFVDWTPRYRQDDARERFSGIRLQTHTPAKRRDVRLVVCVQCLAEFRTPHLPLPWTLGWLSICPKHAVVMTTRCMNCRRRLRLPSFATRCTFNPTRCDHCGSTVTGPAVAANPRVLELQERLLRGKRTGVTELPGIGELTWPQSVTLFDLLVNLFWTGTTYDERWRFVDQFAEDFPPVAGAEMSPYHHCYGGLCMLSWLSSDWSHGRGARVARRLLARWLAGSQSQASRFAGLQAPVFGSAASTLWDTEDTKLRSILVAASSGVGHSSLFPRSPSSIHD
jgi:hypothetical protein